jgi:DNA-binding response OmpR family regulator
MSVGMMLSSMLLEPPAPAESEGRYQVGNVEVRPAELQVLIEGRRAGLTVREFELFSLLAERPDSVIQRPEIYAAIWRSEMPRRNRSVDVLVRKVRGKLEAVAPEWRYIHTHFGIGYRFTPERVGEPEGG